MSSGRDAALTTDMIKLFGRVVHGARLRAELRRERKT